MQRMHHLAYACQLGVTIPAHNSWAHTKAYQLSTDCYSLLTLLSEALSNRAQASWHWPFSKPISPAMNGEADYCMSVQEMEIMLARQHQLEQWLQVPITDDDRMQEARLIRLGLQLDCHFQPEMKSAALCVCCTC